MRPIEQVKRWTDGYGQDFELLRVWNPNEESDAWAEYVNVDTKQTYTCRMEAFRSRFNPQPD
jgi:hypothetical protein